MPVRKLPNGTWIVDAYVDIPGEGRRRLRRKSPLQTKKGAERYEAELVANALSRSSSRPERRFDEYAIEFLENHVRVNLKYSTMVTYESAFSQHLIPYFRDTALGAITTRDIAELQAALSRKRSRKTVRNILAVLSTALHVARDWGYLEAIPPFRLPKPGKLVFRLLSLEDCHCLEAAATDYWRPMIHVARKSGLRLGELCALDWEQLNLDTATILVDRAIWRGRVSLPKHDRIRTVDLPPSAVRTLARLANGARRPRGLVFPNAGGRVRLERNCDRGLRRCARRAGLDPFGWHVLRHAYASHLVMAGVPLPAVQELLGHATITMTMRYAHLSPSARIRAVALLDEDERGQYLGSDDPKTTQGPRVIH